MSGKPLQKGRVSNRRCTLLLCSVLTMIWFTSPGDTACEISRRGAYWRKYTTQYVLMLIISWFHIDGDKSVSCNLFICKENRSIYIFLKAFKSRHIIATSQLELKIRSYATRIQPVFILKARRTYATSLCHWSYSTTTLKQTHFPLLKRHFRKNVKFKRVLSLAAEQKINSI